MPITIDTKVVTRSARKEVITDERTLRKALTHCDWDDEEAMQFNIVYAGAYSSTSSLEFDSRYRAEEVERALLRVFIAGKEAAKSELRSWIRAQKG